MRRRVSRRLVVVVFNVVVDVAVQAVLFGAVFRRLVFGELGRLLELAGGHRD